MAKILKRLSTKVDKQTGKAEILFRFIGGYRIEARARSGIHVNPKQWSEKKGELKTATFGQEEKTIKTKLDDLCNAILQTAIATDTDKICGEWLTTVIDKFHFPEKYIVKEEAPKIRTLLEIVDEFITAAPERTDSNGRIITKQTIYQYGQLQTQLKKFTKKSRRSDWDLKELNKSFYDAYVKFLYAEGYKLNTVGKHIKNLKVIVNSLPLEIRLHCELIDSKVCKKLTEDIDNVYLTESELEQLRVYDFSRTPSLDRVRDWFLCLCWTGCRYSDLDKVHPDFIKNGFLQFRQQKTNNVVAIPLHPVVRSILEKYPEGIPTPISNQKFNTALKEVCRIVGLLSTERITHTVGGKLSVKEYPKHDLITSHTGRRTFASNAYLRGIETLTIMRITGHKTEAAFLKYIKVSSEQHAAKLNAEWEKIYGAE